MTDTFTFRPDAGGWIAASYRNVVGSGDAAGVTDATLALDKLAEVNGEFIAARARINADPRLSDAGKAEKVREAAERALAELDRMERVSYVRKVSVAAEKARKALEAPLPDASDPAVAVREVEVRAYLAQRPELERRSIIADAARAGDALTVAAALRSPSVLPLADSTTLAEALGALNEARDPDGALRLQTLEEAREVVVAALEDLRRSLRDAAGQDERGYRMGD